MSWRYSRNKEKHMKKRELALVAGAIALGIIAGFVLPGNAKAQAAAPTPTPIAVTAITQTVVKPFTMQLTAEQIAGLRAALAGQGVTFPDGHQVSDIRVMIKPDGSATAIIAFRN